MRHRNYFQRIGLAAMLLTAGMLGGLLAPLSSEAATPPTVLSVTLQVDNGTPVPILNTSTYRACPDTSRNWCYNLLTGPSSAATGTNSLGKTRQFSIASVSSTNTAKLDIADFVGTNQQWLSGYILDPLVDSTTMGTGWTTTETHTATITVTIKYDSCGKRSDAVGSTCTSNKDGAGVRNLSHLSTGQFIAKSCVSPICSGGINYVKDSKVEMSAVADLGPANPSFIVYNPSQDPVPTDYAQSKKPFTYQEGALSSTGTTYSRQSLTTYPSADCRESSTSTVCSPKWTYTIKYLIFGPDQFRKTDSDITLDISENLCFKPQGPPTNNPNNPCKNKKYQNQSSSLIITDTFLTTSEGEIGEGQNAGYPLGQACLLNDPNCRCAGDTCVGAYKFYLKVTPNNDSYQTWNIRASGPGLGTQADPLVFTVTPVQQTIVFPDGSTATGWFGEPNEEPARAKLSTIPSFGGEWRFDIASFPGSPDGGQHLWQLNSINGESKLYGKLTSDGGTVTSDSFTFWDEPTGCLKMGHNVLALQGNDTLWTIWHSHPSTPGTQCQ